MLNLAPGFHENIPAAAYHADDLCDVPTLSSSVAKILLRDTPRHAWFAHPRLNQDWQASEDGKFDLGKAVHEVLLGAGAGYEAVEAADWRSKAAKEAKERIRAAGMTPLLREQMDRVCAAALAIGERVEQVEGCERLFHHDHGRAETVMLWQDDGGALCRGMIDWQGPAESDIVDVKTTAAGLSDAALARTIVNLGYDLSAGFYLRGLCKLRPDLAGRFRWRWVFCEIEPPCEVRVVEADGATLAMGDRKAALAIEKWRACMASGSWPGYPPTVARIDYPVWAEQQWMAREIADDDSLRMAVTGAPVPERADGLAEILGAV